MNQTASVQRCPGLMDVLEEELLAVDAIYPGCVSRDSKSPRRLTIRPFLDTESDAASLTLWMPPNYPDDAPSLLGNIGLRESYLVEVLDAAWVSGQVCLYVLIDNLREHLAERITNITRAELRTVTPQSLGGPSSDDENEHDYHFVISDPIVDRKSTFVARAIAVHSRAEAMAALLWLKRHHKRVARATHNIVAWRLVENGVLMQGIPGCRHSDLLLDNDDDGEDAAGARIAHLLEIMVRSLSRKQS